MVKGTRIVNGQALNLAARYPGLDAKECASSHAARIRKAGGVARVVKFGALDYAVYALGGQS